MPTPLPVPWWQAGYAGVTSLVAEAVEDQRQENETAPNPIVVSSFTVVSADEINEIDLAAPELPSIWEQTWLHALLVMFGGGLAAISLGRILFV